MQKDLDIYLKEYNLERIHQCRSVNKRTSYQVFKEYLSKNKSRKQNLKSMKKTA